MYKTKTESILFLRLLYTKEKVNNNRNFYIRNFQFKYSRNTANS